MTNKTELAQTVAAASDGLITAVPVTAGTVRIAPTSGSEARTAVAHTHSRTTVLPRLEGEAPSQKLVVDTVTRYEPVKVLGSGGMGEVLLVRDQDIARSVAVKRLLPELANTTLLARFVDEIRTVGRLEHPNIVPIHDVGVDEQGRYFFVMKYVEGETLENIIEKLRRGDREAHEQYPFEVRIELFLGVMRALQFAHDQGFIHRDVKPANVMIGRYGEVMLMDWGIAKPVGGRDVVAEAPASSLVSTEKEKGNGPGSKRAFQTRVGSIIGTPAYMAPEQARGANEKLDARSDLFSAIVMFHELVTLNHYLESRIGQDAEQDPTTNLLMVIEKGDYRVGYGGGPAELIHFCIKGLSHKPEDRFQSASEIIHTLHAILEGKVRVQCPITLTKRTTRELGRAVDRSPWISFLGMIVVAALVIVACADLIRIATR